ncbi:MAG: hypothetical protein LBE09_07875, partial [Christensenellaceae bacterium]|nr:hypothetical protein [Christensenellaceae bacterium]
ILKKYKIHLHDNCNKSDIQINLDAIQNAINFYQTFWNQAHEAYSIATTVFSAFYNQIKLNNLEPENNDQSQLKKFIDYLVDCSIQASPNIPTSKAVTLPIIKSNSQSETKKSETALTPNCEMLNWKTTDSVTRAKPVSVRIYNELTITSCWSNVLRVIIKYVSSHLPNIILTDYFMQNTKMLLYSIDKNMFTYAEKISDKRVLYIKMNNPANTNFEMCRGVLNFANIPLNDVQIQYKVTSPRTISTQEMLETSNVSQVVQSNANTDASSNIPQATLANIDNVIQTNNITQKATLNIDGIASDSNTQLTKTTNEVTMIIGTNIPETFPTGDLKLDWNTTPQLSHTQPTYLRIFTEESEPKYWKDVMRAIFNYVDKHYPNIDLECFTMPKSQRTFCSRDQNRFKGNVKRISDDSEFYIYLILAADDIFNICRALLLKAKISYSDVLIYYSNKSSDLEEVAHTMKSIDLTQLSHAQNRILDVIKFDFDNGITDNDIELRILRNKYRSRFNENLNMSDKDISFLLKTYCVKIDKNKYAHFDTLLLDITVSDIESLLEEQTRIGCKRFWIEQIYQHFRDKISTLVNKEILLNILIMLGKRKYVYNKKEGYVCFDAEPLKRTKDEIAETISCLLENESTELTISDIQKKLIFYPDLDDTIKNIKNTLKARPDLFKHKNGKYAHVSCVCITKNEISKLKEELENLLVDKNEFDAETFFAHIEKSMSSVFSVNDIYDRLAICKAIAYNLKDDYIFPADVLTGVIQRKDI